MSDMFDRRFINNYDEHSSIGYILEVDVKYPKYLHDLHLHIYIVKNKN